MLSKYANKSRRKIAKKMPKKKTGARKKAEKLKKRQKDIRASSETKDVVQQPCDFIMASEGVGQGAICMVVVSSHSMTIGAVL